jgi:Xaa-Pro aminopeptidase
MKDDLDQLMEQADLDAVLVIGAANHNPEMAYFTGLIHLSDDRVPSFAIKRRGLPTVLFHHPFERDEASQSGLETKSLSDYGIDRLMREANFDSVVVTSEVLKQAFSEFSVRGRVALYGKSRLGPRYGAIRAIEGSDSDLEFVTESYDTSVLARTRVTKDTEEVERIRAMGAITTAVVADVAEFLTSHQAKNGMLENAKGEVLTIGDVKRRINLWLAMRDAENTEGTIFSIGRDAGVPHSVGQNDQPLELGKTIIFDIFPSEIGGGYFYDFTRTWSLGWAPAEVEALYQDVLEVYDSVFGQLRINSLCRDFQVMTCELFQDRGHPTVLEEPDTTDGYVHSLGHGLGLDVHEAPSFSYLEVNDDILLPNTVFAFEPGLYYPEREMGMRLEDTVWARPDGSLELLADFPKDLVLKVPGA